jgi:hypothetical protein
MKFNSSVCLLLLFILAGASKFAWSTPVIVQFGADGGADIVATDQDLFSQALGSFTLNSNLASGIAYSTSLPTPTSFNGATSQTGNAGKANVDDIGAGGDVDAINIFYSAITELNGMVVWEDFDKGTVANFETNIQSNGSGDIFTNPDSGYRYLIQKESTGDWYISNQVSAFSSNNYFGVGMQTPASSLTWSNFTPHNAGAAIIGSSAIIDLADVGSVGIYFQVHGTGTGTLGMRLRYFKAELSTSGNADTVFASDPITKPDATAGQAYTSSVTADASDPDGDPLTFVKNSGPAWLNIAPNGSLSGTPAVSDVGGKSWSVTVTDDKNASATAVLNFSVTAGSGGFGDNSNPSGWMAFLDLYGLSSTPFTDTDGDGQEDMIEFAFGGNPTDANDKGVLPTLSLSQNDTLDFSFLQTSQSSPGISCPTMRRTRRSMPRRRILHFFSRMSWLPIPPTTVLTSPTHCAKTHSVSSTPSIAESGNLRPPSMIPTMTAILPTRLLTIR